MSRRKRAKEFASCRRCGRSLSDPESKIRGYGPTCFSKVPAMVTKMLEEAGQMRFPGVR